MQRIVCGSMLPIVWKEAWKGLTNKIYDFPSPELVRVQYAPQVPSRTKLKSLLVKKVRPEAGSLRKLEKAVSSFVIVVVVAWVVSARSSSIVGTPYPDGQTSFAPPSAQALCLLLPFESVIVQSSRDETTTSVLFPGVIVSAFVVVLPADINWCPSSSRPHW